jgi:glycosyltransferase involved in cell wall biosynthesis
MAFSTTISEVGGFRWRKILHLLRAIFGILRVRFLTNTGILYYPPASPNMVPFLRDCAILISTRWLFAKTVFHFHANGISKFHDSLSPFWKWLYRLAYHKPDLCICLSHAMQADAIQMGSRKIEIVPNGILDLNLRDARQLQAIHPRPRILFLSNISLEKGVGTLIEALGLLKKRGCAYECTIGGPFASADEEARIRRLVRERNFENDIDWAGPLNPDQKADHYLKSDIFCFPTHYHAEGQPLVLLEAMMFSLPIVATDWRGIPDMIENGKNGFLVPIRSPDSLAQILEKLINEPELRKSMGSEGRKRYSENHTAEKFQNHMEMVLSQLA